MGAANGDVRKLRMTKGLLASGVRRGQDFVGYGPEPPVLATRLMMR